MAQTSVSQFFKRKETAQVKREQTLIEGTTGGSIQNTSGRLLLLQLMFFV